MVFRPDRRVVIGSLAAALCGPARATASARTVAMTFDDLPFANSAAGAANFAEVAVANRKILSTLRDFGAPATGFVVEKAVESYGRAAAGDILKLWTADAFELGNHTYSHADTNMLDLDGIELEVADGETSIRPLMAAAGKPLRFVRFAQNHTGDTLDKSLAIEAMLKRRGYVHVGATIDTSDYVFEAAYQTALRSGDCTTSQRIADAYLDYTASEIDYYADLGRQVLGYEPREIALLHVNRLNTDTLDRILALYVRKGFSFVTLTEAQADPAYAMPTTFATRFGPMWGYRWAKQKGVRIDGSREQEPPS